MNEGDTFGEALANIKSAIKFHIETFGSKELESEPPVLEVFVAEVNVSI